MKSWAYFLEKPWVVRFFGICLIIAPFINFNSQFNYLKNHGLIEFYSGVGGYLKSVGFSHYLLALMSIVIGFIMLTGKKKVWLYVLFLIAAHLFLQLLSYKSPIWKTVYPWLSLLANVSLFIFIADQLVFRIEMHTHKQILLQEDQTSKSWGVVKSLTFDELCVKKINTNFQIKKHNQIELYLDTGLNILCQYQREDNQYIYYKVLNKISNQHEKLYNWFLKIKTSS